MPGCRSCRILPGRAEGGDLEIQKRLQRRDIRHQGEAARRAYPTIPTRILVPAVMDASLPAYVPLDIADPVGANRSIMKKRSALRGRVMFGEPFEGVEQDVV